MSKVQRLIDLLNKFDNHLEQPGDFTEALQIITYLRQLVQETRDRNVTRVINGILRRWNIANGKM